MKINNKVIRLKRFVNPFFHCERSVAILVALTIISSLFIIVMPMAGTAEAGDSYEISLDILTDGTGISKSLRSDGTGISKTLGLRTNFWVGQIHEWVYDNTFQDPSMDNFYLDKPLASEYVEWSESTWHGLVSEDGNYAQAYGDPVYPARMTGDNEARFHVTSHFNDPAGDFSFDIVIVTSTGDIVGTVTNCAYNKAEDTWSITSRTYEGSGLEVQPLMETFVGPDEFYTSIQDGIDNVAEGGTVNVAAGTYDENINIENKTGLTIQSTVDGAATITSSTDPMSTPLVKVLSSSDITIKGFMIDGENKIDPGSNEYNTSAIVFDGSTGTIENNTIKNLLQTGTPYIGGARGTGIYAYNSSSIIITSNRITNYHGNGMRIRGGSADVIGNTIQGCGSQQIYSGDAIRTEGGAAVTINDNDLSNNIYESESIGSENYSTAAGISVHIGDGVTITGNTIYNNTFGVHVKGTATVVAHYNSFTDNGVSGPDEATFFYEALEGDSGSLSYDATNNWWGDASGPTHSSNPGGTGGGVSDNVDYDPWYIDEGMTTLSNAIATLSNLTVDGTTISGFDSSTLTYNKVLPYGTTTVPTVAATTTDSNATKVITQAANLTGTEAQRTATVVVTAEDGTTQLTYSVTFSVAANDDATLSNLTIDGTTVSGFSPSTLTYNKVLPYGTTEVPTVGATTTDSNATKVITQAANLTGTEAQRTARVVVTAEDGTTTKTYKVIFGSIKVTLTKTGPTTANQGNNITYTITYKNIGTFNATNVVVTEAYPSEVSYVSATPAPDTGNNQWTIGTLASGAEETIKVTVHIK